MRNGFAAAIIGLAGVLGISVVHAGEKPPEAFVKSMKTLSTAVQAITKATAAGDFATVKANAVLIKEALKPVEEFWETKKTASATGFAKEAIKATADLETAAALDSSEGVAFAMKEIQTNCAACHAAHRETKPDGTFEIK